MTGGKKYILKYNIILEGKIMKHLSIVCIPPETSNQYSLSNVVERDK